MSVLSSVRENMKVIGADGVPLGTVEKVGDGQITLARAESVEGHLEGQSQIIPAELIAEVDGDTVTLSATAANALIFEVEDEGAAKE